MNKNLFPIIFFLSIFISSCGKQTPKMTHEARMDSLVPKILNTEFIYCRLDSVPVYLILGDVIKLNKTFTGFDSLKMKSMEYDSIKDKYVDFIKFKITKVNSDTTDIHFEVNYMGSKKNFMNFQKIYAGVSIRELIDSLGKKSFYDIDTGFIHIGTKVSQFNFKLDSISNSWMLTGSTTEYVN